ncbi:uncharacterized protein LAESUDRAFT_810144 [Laetiporus sulphureus 93-53]|uniref:Uncharacterized protein n=1 Tax=Laetiporus sulphureus 93-53 TaxID=1314785 RepID=A0A165GM93_9APHY|nr:uncharacterized protein LAESUDRAFT_810144 [Laetiporus sulphureus 93-53]KZT10546.1 hypothetical protein LAESUDRAFT_810144 [Laetiporus sulphureus 93-53]
MPPRRHPPQSNGNTAAGSVTNARPQQTPSPLIPMQQQPKRQIGMTPAIYENNMRVLLRREPTITSIFDQFSHVCVYHHNGSKWEKQGYEGSMFLFEKQTYPPYGFFILNRMGTEDYIRPIYPEDDMDVLGDYVMYRYYPKFTQVRVAMDIPYPIPPERRAALEAEVMRHMTPEEIEASRDTKGKEWRGSSVTIGLWMFATDAREPLKDVMMRLHFYIKQNKPYPEEFRYGPGRPPPPNPHLRTASRSSISSASQDEDDHHHPRMIAQPTNMTQAAASAYSTGVAPTTTNAELDKLFAKLLPSAPSTPAPAVQAPAAQPTTSTLSIDDLFASITGAKPVQASKPPIPVSASPAQATSTRGLALLDSIFASASHQPLPQPEPQPTADVRRATPVYAPPLPHSSLPSQPEEIQITSPKPQSSTLPQILNQNVIASLLGLSAGSGSRSSSAAPSSAGSRRSGLNRYEGDNEFSEGEAVSESGYSASSTVLDADASPAVLAAGSSSGLPLLAALSLGRAAAPNGRGTSGIEGDVTPRAAVRGMEPFSPSLQAQENSHLASVPSVSAASLTTSDASSTSSSTPAENASRQRPLVPFEADSELWPYPRAPLEETVAEDDADVVELDFTDTRALSDPILFSSRLKEKQSKPDGAEKKKKKNKKERLAQREKQKEEIEQSWDDPMKGQVRTREQAAADVAATSASAPVVNGAVNGAVNGKKATNGAPVASKTNGNIACSSGRMQAEAAAEAIISTVASQPGGIGKDVSRNDFVQELLTLIHTDRNFVDRLWHGYLERAA